MKQTEPEQTELSLPEFPLAVAAEGKTSLETQQEDRRGDTMPHTADNEPVSGNSFLKFVESGISASDPDDMAFRASASLLQATASLREELRGDAFLPLHLRLMGAAMEAKGDSTATLRRYAGKLRALHALYTEPDPDSEKAFSEIRALALEPARASLSLRPQLERLRRLVADPTAVDEEWSLELRIMEWLFFSGIESLEEIIGLRIEDLETDSSLLPQQTRLLDLQRQPRRKFLFPLDQGRQRRPAIQRQLSERLQAFAAANALQPRGTAPLSPLDLVKGLRAEAAAEEHLGPAAVRSLFGAKVPPSHAWLGILSREDAERVCTPEEREKARALTAASLQPVVQRWYVMQLRHGVTPEQFYEYVQTREPALAEQIEYYYPTYTLTIRKGKKKSIETRPYIPQMLFYRTLPSLPGRIFSLAGNLAWGLRSSRNQDAPYSVIPDSDMILFRRVIGQLPAGSDISLTEAEPIRMGQRVRVTGGIMKGYEGIVVALPNDRRNSSGPGADDNNSHPLLFQLSLSADSALRWTVEIEDQYLQHI